MPPVLNLDQLRVFALIIGAGSRISASVVRSKERVLQETYRLLFEGGMGGVSVDEVARRSGVAKTTIYRHWPTRSALVLDACSKLGAPEPSPDTGDFNADMLVLAQRVAAQLNNASWPSVLPSIIDAAERDPDVAQLHATMHAGNMKPFLQAIDQAKERGKLNRERDTATLISEVVGPLFYRRWFSKEPIDDAFVAEVVAHALR